MADLTAKGWAILVPLTEHEAFDLVAYRDGLDQPQIALVLRVVVHASEIDPRATI